MATILIVDDHPTNREFLITLLGYAGYRLLEASGGAEALEVTRVERPDLAIVDILMPGMDGYEFVRQLRTAPMIAQTRVIFYTATYLQAEAWSLARACDVHQIITKPAEPERVLKIVAEALQRERGSVPQPLSPEEFYREHLQVVTDEELIAAIRKVVSGAHGCYSLAFLIYTAYHSYFELDASKTSSPRSQCSFTGIGHRRLMVAGVHGHRTVDVWSQEFRNCNPGCLYQRITYRDIQGTAQRS